MQVRYRGPWDTAMLDDYCRSIKRAMLLRFILGDH